LQNLGAIIGPSPIKVPEGIEGVLGTADKLRKKQVSKKKLVVDLI
jgi:hypothetical protein